MAQTIVKNTFTSRSVRITMAIKRDLMESLADTLDNTRNRAARQYVIPNTQGRERRTSKLHEKQPAHPNKLTSRTGAFVKMLRLNANKNKWKFGRERASNRSAAINGSVNFVQVTGTSVVSEAKLSVSVSDVGAFSNSSSVTKQKLRARFFWDLPKGVRGHRRPNLTPALRYEIPNLESNIRSRSVLWGKIV